MTLNVERLKITRILTYERIIDNLTNKDITRGHHIHGINIFMRIFHYT